VGAGPGHPELLTVKAAKLLETGDVIVYDRLIQGEVLALAKPMAERIYMGKKVVCTNRGRWKSTACWSAKPGKGRS